MNLIVPDCFVGIGGSAGALNAYKALLGALPSDTGMAFIIISRIDPTANSHLVEILSRHTQMHVLLATAGITVQANHVYSIPANAEMIIEDGMFKTVYPRAKVGRQIDLFLIALGNSFGSRAFGIVLSGYGGDGTEGCRHIKSTGGMTFAQDSSAEVEEMPKNAQEAGWIDFVLPPEKMPAELQRMKKG